ncbi:hypothetical protein SAMN05216319_4615 [Duganella sp. CF402]|uniref:hypothetical protein n=1 Tax=unclassified Duganella TaxID=2636909 RepID=UPI0008D25765|nr:MULTISPECIES: hypothetical protein [unclassified Duganella]RZT06160.1 hypothetical protein EV582_4486 [Duganella sp. BK701]SEM73823.1 hypothetical protein SAMN05216319_4615 [Duganella sp. CF402]
MNTSIYDKTDKGREEIATRKFQLASRLRALLVLVDGHRSKEELLRNVAGIGLTESALQELLEQGYILLATSYASLPEPEVAAPAEPAADVDPVQQFRSIYNFYNKTIKSTMGLRGFPLQLKVEKAGSVAELRELRAPYLEGVTKAKGRDTAALLVQQLDQLLAN